MYFKSLLEHNHQESVIQLKQFLDETYLKKFHFQYISKKHLNHPSLQFIHSLPEYAKPDHVFELQYRDEVTFENKLIAFHGSSMERFYSILKNGLQNYSSTTLQQHGNVFGNGVYFCKDIRVAKDFTKSGPTWPKSQLLGTKLSCVAVCEIDNSNPSAVFHELVLDDQKKNSYLIVKNSTCIKIKYVFVYVHQKNKSISQQTNWKAILISKQFWITVLFIIASIVILNVLHHSSFSFASLFRRRKMK